MRNFLINIFIFKIIFLVAASLSLAAPPQPVSQIAPQSVSEPTANIPPPDAVVSYIQYDENNLCGFFRANVNTAESYKKIDRIITAPRGNLLHHAMKVNGNDVHFAVTSDDGLPTGSNSTTYIKLVNNDINSMIIENIPGFLNVGDFPKKIDLVIGRSNGVEIPIIAAVITDNAGSWINMAAKIGGSWSVLQNAATSPSGNVIDLKTGLNLVETNGNTTGVNIVYSALFSGSSQFEMLETYVSLPNLSIGQPISLSQPSFTPSVYQNYPYATGEMIWKGQQTLAFTSDALDVQYKFLQSGVWGLPIIIPPFTSNPREQVLVDMVDDKNWQFAFVIINESRSYIEEALVGHSIAGGRLVSSFNIAPTGSHIEAAAMTDVIDLRNGRALVAFAREKTIWPFSTAQFLDLYYLSLGKSEKLMNIDSGPTGTNNGFLEVDIDWIGK